MADFKFEFGRRQISKISRERIIEELEKVARAFNYKDFTEKDFDKLSEISHFTINRNFGSWRSTMQFLKDHLKRKGIEFDITSRRKSYSVQEMFHEMERIWLELGHRPSRDEWVAHEPVISYDTLYRHFGGWKNACLKFIEYKSGETISLTEENKLSIHDDKKTKRVTKARTISLSTRIKVLSRDNFRCVFCGKSPATDLGTKLHIDHIIPFSKGGTNNLDNLQTLCEKCNIGKGDIDLIKR